jgi:hypothetical protein
MALRSTAKPIARRTEHPQDRVAEIEGEILVVEPGDVVSVKPSFFS